MHSISYPMCKLVWSWSYGHADCTVVWLQVRMLIGLIRKVTGVTISAFFKKELGYKYSGREMEMPWHSNTGFGHNIRKYRMRCDTIHLLFLPPCFLPCPLLPSSTPCIALSPSLLLSLFAWQCFRHKHVFLLLSLVVVWIFISLTSLCTENRWCQNIWNLNTATQRHSQHSNAASQHWRK